MATTNKTEKRGRGQKMTSVEREAAYKVRAGRLVTRTLVTITRIGDLTARGGSTPSDHAKILSALAGAVERLNERFSAIRSNPAAAKTVVSFTL